MKRRFAFTKFQGCGNDFLIIDETSGPRTADRVRSQLARTLTNRHFHVGADGIMFLEEISGADCSMRLFEPAGNEADMCGNGIRCIAAFMMDKLGKDAVDIFTRDGIKHIRRIDDKYRVDMGRVRTTRADLKEYLSDKGRPGDSMLSISIRAAGKTLKGSIVNSGEPHIVVRTKNIDDLDMIAIGDSVNSNTKRFPKGVNINFAQVAGQHSIKIRTYERGVYSETLACGTGATACAAVALMLRWVKPGEVNVKTRGGALRIELDEAGNARMTGPALKVFEGSVSVDL